MQRHRGRGEMHAPWDPGSSRRRPQHHARGSAGWDGHAVGIEGQPGVGSLPLPRLASAAPDHEPKRAATV